MEQLVFEGKAAEDFLALLIKGTSLTQILTHLKGESHVEQRAKDEVV